MTNDEADQEPERLRYTNDMAPVLLAEVVHLGARLNALINRLREQGHLSEADMESLLEDETRIRNQRSAEFLALVSAYDSAEHMRIAKEEHDA